jgi:alcohol dehydrogenase
MSICGIHTVSLGLSHALGHQLGAFGVPHGVTSCLTLPHVMRFLEPATKIEQHRIARALYPNLEEDRSAADLMAGLLEELAVPRRIRDFAIAMDDLDAIAERALADVVIRECPVELSRDGLRELLKQAW